MYGSWGVLGDLTLAFSTWGYTFGLLAVAAMVAALVLYDRGRRRGRLVVIPGLLGMLASLVHPWQGEMLILILLVAELAMWRHRVRRTRPLRLLTLTVVLTAIPLLYYLLLGRLDPSWELARDASKHSFSFLVIALGLAPLALPALLGYRGEARSFLDQVVRIWPPAAVAVFFFSGTGLSATPLHAFDGIAIPLAVLAVRGIGQTRFRTMPGRRMIAGVAIAAVTIPATAILMRTASTLAAPTAGNANFITRGEQQALQYLASDPQSGGVLTNAFLGAAIPAETGRQTYIGDCLWSEPNCQGRYQQVFSLFGGWMSASDARALVRTSGARFVLADCATTANIPKLLGSEIASVQRFGCAAVYRIA
jgi:hypothetical protein